MEFLEESKGIYRPIRVLFNTPIYNRALQICWNISNYQCQVALMMELLSLQQKKQIPSWVTAEDMTELILEKSKNTVIERLWEFELEAFDEDEALPLLTLLWAVNVSNKRRDVEFAARMLLKSPEAVPPYFRHQKVLNIAREYAMILWNLEAPSPKLLCPREVVIQVVPRVLQGFWALHSCTQLNMPSQLLSKLSVGIAKATLDRLFDALTTEGCQANFTRSIRDDMVLSILMEIRQTWPRDILVDSIKNFAPVLLSEIADVTTMHICEVFEPRNPEVPALLTSQEEMSAAISEEMQIHDPEINSAEVQGPLSYPYEAEAKIHGRMEGWEDGNGESSPKPDPKTSFELGPAALTILLPHPAEPAARVQARKDPNDEDSLEMDPSTEVDTDAVVTPLLSPPTEPATTVLDGEEGSGGPSLEMDPSTEVDTAAVVTPSLSSSPTETTSVSKVEAREDGNEGPDLEIDPRLSTAQDTAVVTPHVGTPLMKPASKVQAIEDFTGGNCQMMEGPNTQVPLEPVVIVNCDSAVDTSVRGRVRRFLNSLRPLFCCFPRRRN